MKKFILIAVLLATAPALRSFAQGDAYVSYQAFYDGLAPYGQWVMDAEYGYVWVPNVNDDFRPYFTEGHWVMTEYGNTWVSDYPWGWACFHYGRWIYNDFYGWTWIPGSEWGPGWVAWRWGDGYCGWAPLYPGFVWAGVGYGCPDDWWIFIHPRYLYWPLYHNRWREDYWHGPRHTRTIISRTHFVSNTFEGPNGHFYSGPRGNEIEQVTHQPVQVYRLDNTSTRGPEKVYGNAISTYRPARVEPMQRDGSKPVPSRVMEAPRPVNRPSELNNRWDQPRQFKSDMQQKSPEWNRPFIRNAPPYISNRPGQPAVRPSAPSPRQAPAIRQAPQRQAPQRAQQQGRR